MIEPKPPVCPDCGGPMIQRTNRRTGMDFWGCSTYPACSGTRETLGEESPDDEGSNNDLPSSRQSRNDRSRWRDE